MIASIIEILQLLNHGANVHQIENSSNNLLAQAIKFRHVDCLKLLLQQYTTTSFKHEAHSQINSNSFTPLMLAIAQNQSEAVKQLLEYGDNPLEETIDKECALSFACFLKDISNIKLFCQYISKVPPIASHWGCLSGDPEILNIMIIIRNRKKSSKNSRLKRNSTIKFINR